MVLQITPSERTALELPSSGLAAPDIARLFGGTQTEIQGSLAALFSRLGVASRTEAVTEAHRRGLLSR
jgi:DNA-binding NarL/FixJ family response regulator